jgi:hypothetical protein
MSLGLGQMRFAHLELLFAVQPSQQHFWLVVLPMLSHWPFVAGTIDFDAQPGQPGL